MKLIHLSDLHIGKRVNEYSMIEDQRYILDRIVDIISDIRPDGVLICGDVYDRAAPGDEAVRVLDEFLTGLFHLGVDIYMISGNHDSASKLSFASKILDDMKLHISPVYDGRVTPYTIKKDISVNIYMLPFIKPSNIKAAFPEVMIDGYTEALKYAIEKMDIDENHINILLSHQYVNGALRTDSEDISIGGLDGVPVSVFDGFDYVALGHLHKPQSVGRDTIRYAGSPLKYSASETDHEKSITVIDIQGKNKIKTEIIPLKPLRDMIKIKGGYDTLMSRSYLEKTDTDSYIHAILTDEEDVPDALSKLRTVYPHIMSLRYENKRTSENREITPDEKINIKSPIEIWEEFYETQNNKKMSEEQRKISTELIKKIWS